MARARCVQPLLDDRVALLDQGSFLGLRALGHQPCFHATWLYDRPVDLPALERFNRNLTVTLLGRLIEPSPVPGGRHRWVAIDEPPPVEVETEVRPRAEVMAWTDEVADRGTDPEHGPGWRIGVLPLDDGGTAVTMIIPHALGDGLCVLQALDDAVAGRHRLPAYPRRGEVPRWRVALADLGGLILGVPAVVRAVAAGIRVARAQGGRPAGSAAAPPKPAPRSVPETGRPFHVPAACRRVDQEAWDATSERLGGTSNTLSAALAAQLGLRLGRTDAAGHVTLAVPVSTRVEGDTSANALDAATIDVDPSGLTEDLRGLRARTKEVLTARSRQAHDLVTALPLIPLMPRAVARRAEVMTLGAAASPVGQSNHGELPPTVARIDGGDPADFWVRLHEPGMTPADVERIGGQLYLLTGRLAGRVYVSALGWPADGGDGCNPAHLERELLAALADFGLEPLPPIA